MDELLVCRLGTVEYRAAMALQEELRERVALGELPDLLLLLEHPAVYTLGRRSKPEDLPMGKAACRERGVDVVHTPRGGKLTYHGPGQLVGYPIMRVDDVLAFLRTMEGALIAALGSEGLEAEPRRRLTGVWVENRKIASIGIHLAHGVSTHGFAVNVDNDLAPFSWVVPCGLAGVEMTSVARETGRPARFEPFREAAAAAFAEAYGRVPRAVAPEALAPAGAPA